LWSSRRNTRKFRHIWKDAMLKPQPIWPRRQGLIPVWGSGAITDSTTSRRPGAVEYENLRAPRCCLYGQSPLLYCDYLKFSHCGKSWPSLSPEGRHTWCNCPMPGWKAPVRYGQTTINKSLVAL
jgi:hypothetical protein